MASSPSQQWLKVEPLADTAVVRFLQPRILDEELIDHIGQELFRLIEQEGCRRMVLDFARVEVVSTHMLGELLVLHKRMRAAAGRLALCEFRPSLREVFEVLKLPAVLHTYDTEDEALKSFDIATI